jgi:hypothetical protein
MTLSAVPAAMQAQLCTGQAPWSVGSLKVGGRAEFGSGFTDLLGGIGWGKDKGIFINANGGIRNGGGATGGLLSGEVGKELKTSGKVALCPVVDVDIQLPKDHVSAQRFSGGVTGGYPLSINSKNMTLSLSGAARLAADHRSASSEVCDSDIEDCTNTDILAVFDAGVGLVFNNRISLVPVLRLPTKGDVSLRITANVAIGKK